MSIFNTYPPIVDNKILYQWLLKEYKIFNNGIIEIKKLNSERDCNLKITTKNKYEYVVKISNPSEKLSILSFQDSILTHLSKSRINKYIPRILHKNIKEFRDLRNRYCYVRILSYLKGDVFANKQESKLLCKNLAMFLGNLTIELKNFDHLSAHRNFIWNSINIEWIEHYINLFVEQSKKDIILNVLLHYKKIVVPKLSKIRYSVIHGDANNYNIISSKNNIVGLLDYGDSIYAPTICELTVSLAYSLMNCNNIIEKCCYMVKSFHSVFPLTKDEIEAISVLITTRLSITVVMAIKQKNKYPNNDYLTISEKDAWKLLFKINEITFDELTRNLLKVCKYE